MPGTYFRRTGGSGCGAWREGGEEREGRAGPQGVEGVGPAGGWDPAPAWSWSWEGQGSQPGSDGRGPGKEPARRGTESQARRKRGFGVLGGSPCHRAVGTPSAQRRVRKGRVGGVKFLVGGVLCPPRPYRKRGACLCARVCPCVRLSVKLTEGRGTKEGSQTEKLGLLPAGLRPLIVQESALGSGPGKEFERNWELHPWHSFGSGGGGEGCRGCMWKVPASRSG